MSLTTVAVLNAILAVAVVSALAYVCRVPFGFEHPATDYDVAALDEGELLAA